MAEPVDLDAFDAWSRDPYGGGHDHAEVAAHALRWSRKVVAEVRIDREAREELCWALREVLVWAKRHHSGDPKLDPEEYYRTTEHAQRMLDHFAPASAEVQRLRAQFGITDDGSGS